MSRRSCQPLGHASQMGQAAGLFRLGKLMTLFMVLAHHVTAQRAYR
jgi:hypothetical protein